MPLDSQRIPYAIFSVRLSTRLIIRTQRLSSIRSPYRDSRHLNSSCSFGRVARSGRLLVGPATPPLSKPTQSPRDNLSPCSRLNWYFISSKTKHGLLSRLVRVINFLIARKIWGNSNSNHERAKPNLSCSFVVIARFTTSRKNSNYRKHLVFP